MDIQKIRYISIILLVIGACTNPFSSETSSKSNETLSKELEVKNQIIKKMIKDIHYQNNVINEINFQLNLIDSLTLKLNEVEIKKIAETQANDILFKIERLKNYLNESKKTISGFEIEMTGLLELISKYKSELEKKEIEINQLKLIINQREQTIKTNETHISKLEKETGKVYFDLACELEKLADELPMPKGLFIRKTKKEIDSFRFDLYSKAILYYSLAVSNGYQSGLSKQQSVQQKLIKYNGYSVDY